ncbi:MAG: hypothetical protein AB8G96_05385 [Phycisphaerales bacterium]
MIDDGAGADTRLEANASPVPAESHEPFRRSISSQLGWGLGALIAGVGATGVGLFVVASTGTGKESLELHLLGVAVAAIVATVVVLVIGHESDRHAHVERRSPEQAEVAGVAVSNESPEYRN